jgi:MFS family permease
MTVAAPARPASMSQAGLRRVLATLCITEITSWGVLIYAFPVLSPTISAATGWSTTSVVGAFSVGQLAAAAVGIPVGRRLDRSGPRRLMTAGSLLGVVAVVAISVAPSVGWFLGAWVLAGAAMGAVLYPPAFAALTRWYGTRRVSALTVLTLAGGLASTVFAPLTATLDRHLGWRGTYLVLAGVLAAITVPGHWWGLRGQWPRVGEAAEPEPRPAVTPTTSAPARIAGSRPFLLLVAALTMNAFVASAVVVNLVPLLTERGLETGTAAIALGLVGVGQVLGRVGFTTLHHRTGVRTRTALVLVATSATTALLAAVTSPAALIIAAVLTGMARGVFTLLQATAITDRWGAAHYGRLAGLLTAPLTITTAAAPWAGAATASWLGSYAAMFGVLAAINVTGVLLALASPAPHPPRAALAGALQRTAGPADSR